VCGRLGDLGTIDKKYDIAISTSCGYLEFIVVETIEDGEACISYLKDNNVGRVNLICLDRVGQ
jgi:structural maintenance of chromosome 4